MLTSTVQSRREWGLFAAAALVPALAMGALALRAISNEDAGVRREAALAITAAARQTSLDLDRAVAGGTQSLEQAVLEGTPDKLAEALRKLAPPFAEPFVLTADRTLLIPPPSLAPTATAPAHCASLIPTLASAADEDQRTAARRTLLQQCAEAKTPAGRWIWPIVALDALGRGEADEAALAVWFESHRGMLTDAERAASVLEVQAATSITQAHRDRMLAALQPSASRRDALGAALRSDGVQTALRTIAERPGSQSLSFRSDTSIGALRALGDGRIAGFVVHAGSLSDALAVQGLSLPAGVRVQVLEGPATERTGATASLEPTGERIEAFVEIAPQLSLRLSPSDPAAVTRQASTSRFVLAGIGAGATAIAFLLAAILFARMRAARRLGALRTDFVATVSHELRTPIASVRMLAELLDEGRIEPSEQRDVMNALAREAKRLGDTVERLLGFSRMAANRYTLNRTPTRVADAVAASIDAFDEHNAGAPPIVRELDAEAMASIDAGQIRLAVDNLLANARKYAPEGGPYQVRVERTKNGVSICVADRGPGIKKRDQHRIFEPFERGDDRLSRATEGSGIGLSLVRHVARAHGGRVSVESDPGKGAAFTIWIPGRTE